MGIMIRSHCIAVRECRLEIGTRSAAELADHVFKRLLDWFDGRIGRWVFRPEHDFAEAFDQDRIAPTAASLLRDHLECLLGSKCRLIGTGRCQRIVDISQLENSGEKRDFLSFETIRIASGATPI
jgi:hypothetical protein